jgi:hypothetical protein
MISPALANPPLLLTVFGIVCVPIYISTSRKFLNKGILANNLCKPGLRDWIKVNAIVTVVVSLLMLFQLGMAITQPNLLSQELDQAIAMQPSTQQMPKELLIKSVKTMAYIIAVIHALLLVHIIITLRLLKRYKYLFDDSPASGSSSEIQ